MTSSLSKEQSAVTEPFRIEGMFAGMIPLRRPRAGRGANFARGHPEPDAPAPRQPMVTPEGAAQIARPRIEDSRSRHGPGIPAPTAQGLRRRPRDPSANAG